MLEIGRILKEERTEYAKGSLESSAAVTQRIAMQINDAARNETDNLGENILKAFEAPIVSVVDAQIERDLRLDGEFQNLQTEDVLPQYTQKRHKMKSGKQINIGNREYGSAFGKLAIQIFRTSSRYKIPTLQSQFRSDQLVNLWEIDSFSGHMETHYCRYTHNKSRKLKKIQRKKNSSWIANAERTAREDCGGFMRAAEVHKGNSVTSIKKSWIIKCIDLVATIQEINRESGIKMDLVPLLQIST
ncbi:MAG: hypothetical protein EZS28_009801 [Streblomastix strix]|uniref:Uncharacterized protein n=1 Tax=Streblomastix strix TaxID=222440 RepID=A0A5J4WJI2_9EUKA|nr:MAG: hypothetical protein EZS28_009801 [Streblomastix strix]